MNRFLSLFLGASLIVNTGFGQKKKKASEIDLLAQKIESTESEFVSGFVLKDLQNGNTVYEHNANKKFVLGSNTRILTLLGGLYISKDSIPSFKYAVHADSLIIYPIGDPTFLHPDFKNQPAFDFLKQASKSIYLAHGLYKGPKFGKNWPWDNYDSALQTEITDFPIYGNVVSFAVLNNGNTNIYPDLASMYFSENTMDSGIKKIKRHADSNNLTIPNNLQAGYFQKIPLKLDASLQAGLLTDTLLASGYSTTSVVPILKSKIPANASFLNNTKSLDVYKALIKNSESLFGEQLLLNYCASLDRPLSTENGIQECLKVFRFNKEGLNWQDGSGLSYQNLGSPNIITDALQEIVNKLGDTNMALEIFEQATPKIYIQQGTLINTHNTSGFIIGNSGKKYAFSFLHNNIKSGDNIQKRVEEILNFVQEHY